MCAQLSIHAQQTARCLCHCADCQGPPISAASLPLPPPYARSPSLEFHTPPLEVCSIDDTSTAPFSPTPVLAPPPAPQSLLLFSNAENIPPACCGNPLAPSASLVPIEEVTSDAEDSNEVAERLEDQVRDEDACHFLNVSNQSRGAHHRAVHAIACHPAPYPHHMQAGECHPHWKPLSLRESSSNVKRTNVLTEVLEVMSPPMRNPTPAVRTVSFLTDHQLELRIRALQAA